mgnify:CR=1 FL=1
MAKCVVYMRYSTDHQKATSFDRQLAEINKFCQKNDIQICNIFAANFGGFLMAKNLFCNLDFLSTGKLKIFDLQVAECFGFLE